MLICNGLYVTTLIACVIATTESLGFQSPLIAPKPFNGPRILPPSVAISKNEAGKESKFKEEADAEADALFALHRDLVNIDSTPDNEHDIGVYLEKYLQSLNFTVERQNIPLYSDHPNGKEPAQRFNVFAHPPSHRTTPILLTSHIDTVPIFYPYHLNTTTDEIWGRGSVDAKACVATQIHTALRLRRSSSSSSSSSNLADSLSLLFVTGEEVSGDGMKAANALSSSLIHPWRTVIFGEPTESKLVSGHKGLLMFSLTAHGVASHSGYPWLGHSAVTGLLRALNALLDPETFPLPWSEKYGNSTLNIGRIEGGVASNVMPARATADIGIRIADGTATDLAARVSLTIRRVTEAFDEKIDVVFKGPGYAPVDIDVDVDGFDTMTVNYGTDIPNLNGEHKRYLYGPGSIFVAHGDHEHLSKGDLLRAVDDYEKLVRAVADR